MVEKEKVKEVEKEKEKEKEVVKEVEREEVIEVCPECGSPRIVRDYKRGELVCQDCGYVIEERYIDSGPEWRAFDSEQREKRSRVGAPITFSVDADEPIVVRLNGEVKVVKIGELVDSLIEKKSKEGKVRREGILEIADVSDENLEVVAFDENYKFSFRKVSEVSRHPVDEMFEVVVEGNKRVRVTGSHSVFTVIDNEVVPIRVDQLRKGDFVVLARRLPSLNNGVDRIDLSKIVKNAYIQFEYDFENKDWKRRGSAPVSYVLENGIKIPENATIRVGSGYRVPVFFNVDERFARILGYYLAEGHMNDNKIVFSFGKHETDYISEVTNYFEELGLNPKVYDKGSAVQIEVNSKPLVELFKALGIGGRAREKRVPTIVYEMPDELKLEFLKGYFNGDGNLYVNEGYSTYQLTAVSCNKELINDLIFLLLQLGINSNYNTERIKGHEIAGQFVGDSVAHMLKITNPDSIAKLKYMAKVIRQKKKPPIEELIPAPQRYAKEWKCRRRLRISRSLALRIAEKHKDEKLRKIAESDFVFLRVKEIKRVKPTNGYAYDLSVPNAENFVAGMGFVLHNTIHDKGLTTIIDWNNKDYYGKAISVRTRAQLFRLRKWQRRIRISNATERNLAFALSELDRMASALGLPKSVRETAAVIYRKAIEKNLIRGRSIEGVVAAALYAACRQAGVPRTLDEIAQYSRVDRKEIGRTYRFIARELGLKLMPTSPADYVPRFCAALGLSGEVQRKAIEIIKKAEERELTSGRGPTGVAAAAIYIASILCGERRTQREVAEVAGVTEVTIRNRYKELAEKLGIDIIL